MRVQTTKTSLQRRKAILARIEEPKESNGTTRKILMKKAVGRMWITTRKHVRITGVYPNIDTGKATTKRMMIDEVQINT